MAAGKPARRKPGRPAGAASSFRQRDVTRLMQLAEKRGYEVKGVSIEAGKIAIITGRPGAAGDGEQTNPLDRILDDDDQNKKRIA